MIERHTWVWYMRIVGMRMVGMRMDMRMGCRGYRCSRVRKGSHPGRILMRCIYF